MRRVPLPLALLSYAFAARTPVPLEVYERWGELSLPEKLYFMLEGSEWTQLRRDFGEMDVDESGVVSWEEFVKAHEEFSSVEDMAAFFTTCEKEEGGAECNYISYCIARGAFDKHGEAYLDNELEMRDNMIVEEMEDILDRNEDNIKGYEFDENGIIVD